MMEQPAFIHQPVLLKSLLEIMSYRPDAVVVDATVGQGGHAEALAQRLNEAGCLVGLDVDPDSLKIAAGRLSKAPCRVQLIRENFGNLAEVLSRLNIKAVDVIFADLGVCSGQLDDPRRGLSLQQDGPLDMRLDDRLTTTAADLVNSLKVEELADIIWRYGEERFSRRIARTIEQFRREKLIETTGELVAAINSALGISSKGHRSRIHPATRTFQALRIAVNDELGMLQRLLDEAPQLLRVGGVVAIISFHSLEDRPVKWNFRENARLEHYEILTKKPLMADENEMRANPRSRSAKLRAAKRR